MENYQLVLASTSPFRQQLLEKLAIPFSTLSPNCDETPLEGESPQQLVLRLAESKAQSCQINQPSLVIGSDQVCVIDGNIVGKPQSRQNAIAQLTAQSGQSIVFYTGLAVYNSETGETRSCIDEFKVHFRPLTQAQIERYVDKEQPFFCAGSFKSEGLGIALFEKLEGKDPNTLVGLPLIDLIDLLGQQGMHVLG
ncbi:septum formation inhibitor Maf [Vibrio vulnificus]|nr:septum formation inhibitor Maf [Vibrio vulnificus]EJU9866871.1 septum formation inhibitor Maf [Vibrio vulnificus]ELL0559961.1 septum formation inhibitor Maf [Vibrio vulnificus]